MMDKLQYAFGEIARNYDRRTWWQNRVANLLVAPIQARVVNQTGMHVLDSDWDTLLVLDACRADLFEEVVDTSQYDKYERVYSAGSATDEWSKTNFTPPAKTDCVYVTGNPVVSREVRTAFHCFLEPWREHFDADIGTVPPEPVTDAALEAREQYPNKRLIVHYLQPHYPFIEDPQMRYAEFNGTDEVEVHGAKQGAVDIWEALGRGFEAKDDVWDAYARNLERVLEAVEPLLSGPGKTVITSDHGNMLGERMSSFPMKLYGHPPGIHHPVLREVPWATIEGDREEAGDRQVEADVEEQLRSLGYAD